MAPRYPGNHVTSWKGNTGRNTLFFVIGLIFTLTSPILLWEQKDRCLVCSRGIDRCTWLWMHNIYTLLSFPPVFSPAPLFPPIRQSFNNDISFIHSEKNENEIRMPSQQKAPPNYCSVEFQPSLRGFTAQTLLAEPKPFSFNGGAMSALYFHRQEYLKFFLLLSKAPTKSLNPAMQMWDCRWLPPWH